MNQGNKQLTHLRQVISTAHEYALQKLYDEINAHAQLLQQIETLLQSPASTHEALQAKKEGVHRLIQQTEHRLKQRHLSFSKDSEEYLRRSETTLRQLPEVVEHIQARERYYVQPGDPLVAYLIKPFKRISWQISRLPQRTANLFRKQKKSITYGRQRTTLRGIAAYICLYQLPEALLPVHIEWFRLMNRQLAAIKKLSMEESSRVFPLALDSQAPPQNIAALLEEVAAFKKEQQEYIINELGQKHINTAETYYAKAGTWELSNRRFRPAAIRRKQRKLDKHYRRALRPHHRLATLLLADWRAHESLIKVSCEVKRQEEQLMRGWQALRDDFAQNVEASSAFMESIKHEITERPDIAPQDIEAWFRRLHTERDSLEADIKRLLDRHKPGEQLTAHELHMDDFFKKQQLYRPLMRQINFEQGAPKKAAFVNLSQLMQYESLPVYHKALKEIKTGLARALTKIESRLLQNWEAVLFNFQTVTQRLQEQEEGVSAQEVLSGALQRAIEQIRQAGVEFQETIAGAQQKLLKADERFVEGLLEMEQIDRLLSLQLRIRKAQARERLRHYRRKAWDFILHLPAYLLRAWQVTKEKVSHYYQQIGIRLGLLDNPLLLDIPIADFLATASARVQSLPFIYRKLFEPQPLDNWRFYIARPEAESQVKKHLTTGRKAALPPSLSLRKPAMAKPPSLIT